MYMQVPLYDEPDQSGMFWEQGIALGRTSWTSWCRVKLNAISDALQSFYKTLLPPRFLIEDEAGQQYVEMMVSVLENQFYSWRRQTSKKLKLKTNFLQVVALVLIPIVFCRPNPQVIDNPISCCNDDWPLFFWLSTFSFSLSHSTPYYPSVQPLTRCIGPQFGPWSLPQSYNFHLFNRIFR